MTNAPLAVTVVVAPNTSTTGVRVCCAEPTVPLRGVMLTGVMLATEDMTTEVTGGAVVVTTTADVVVMGVIATVTITAAVVTGKGTEDVVTGGRGIASRGMLPAMVTTGAVVMMAGGKGAGSGLIKLAIWSLSSAVRNPLAQSTRAKKRVFLPSTLISLNCLRSCSLSSLSLG